MKMKNIKSILLIGSLVLFLISSGKQPASHGLSEGWIVKGSHPKSYKMGTDSIITKSGDYSITLKSLDDKIEGFGTLTQQCSPDKFLGKRIRMSAYVKSENITKWSGLWVRVAADTTIVSFDNMQDRPITGTTDWKKYEIVLDVPTNATNISYGALLAGTGQIWLDDVSFEIVDKTVEVTGVPKKSNVRDVDKATFKKFNDSCNVELNKHYMAKEYDAAIKVMYDIKNKYDNLNQATKDDLKLDAKNYYCLAALFASKNDADSTLKNLKKAMLYGEEDYYNFADFIYPKYKDNPAFAKCFLQLYKRYQIPPNKYRIPLTNIVLTPANIAQPGSGVEKIADGRRTTEGNLFHTLWHGIPRQDICIVADMQGKGRRLDKIVLSPRATGLNGVIKTAGLWVMTNGKYQKITTIHAELSNMPVEIELEKPILNPEKIKLLITDSYGDMNSNLYMVSLGELECLTLPDDAIRKSAFLSDMKLFSTGTLSLKPEVTEATINKMSVPTLKKLATALYNHSYQTSALKVECQPYLNPNVITDQMHMSDGFSKYEGITGVLLDEGDHLIFVGDTIGSNMKLLIPDWTRKTMPGIQPDKDPEGWGLQKEEFVLQDGLNLIHVNKGGNAYIQYFTNTNPADFRPITVQFLTGKKNGYFDITRGDTNEDFDSLLTHATGPVMDIRGKHIQLAFPVESLKHYTWSKGVELVNSFDSIVGMEKQLMGWEKQGFIPTNHILGRVNYQYFMFRDQDGMAFVNWAMEKVADPQKVKTTECWGIGHEMGHVFQMIPQMTWGGMTEVSNNILTMYISTKLGNKSRLVAESRYADAKKHILDKGISYLAFPGKPEANANVYGEDGKSTNVFERLVPFWQLYLYFKQQGYEDFYPDLMIALRKQKPLGGNDPNKSYLNMLEFCRLACVVSKTDLTDFFQRWGFFYVGEINVVDYSHSSYQVTQNEIDALKKAIADMKLPKPAIDITTLEN
jgi:hypothetical protein